MYYSTKKTKELINYILDSNYNHYITSASGSAEKNFWLYCFTEARNLKNASYKEFKQILNDFNYGFKNCSYYTFRRCKQMLNEYFI